jgi:DNA polymerase III alpha subunit
LHTIPAEDSRVYDMICEADTIGVFQIESRAQMSMLPRLRPRCFYDLVIEVAIVRPGPIQGDMVHPYLRRRNGEEEVTYPSEAVRKVLAKTLGVPLFQEQAMALAIVAAGFTPGDADKLRRAMAAWKRKGNQIVQFGRRLVAGMVERGYEREFAERCFKQIQGFSEYGFPESHAASFAHLVYVSCWLKKHHPAAFAAALINSQPMGFYAPAQIIRDAKDHGVEVRPVDVNASTWDCTLEDAGADDVSPALRLGFRMIKGFRQPDADAIADAVHRLGPFDSIEALRRASAVRVAVFRRLAGADAFGSMGCDRQQALWAVRKLRDESLPMFDAVEPPPARAPETTALPPVSLPRKVAEDYAATQLSLKAHPVSFLRDELRGEGVTEARELADEKRWPHGRRVAVAGLAICRQRPSTANGIVFMTLEDETGISNLIISPEIYQRDRRIARHGVSVVARGKITASKRSRRRGRATSLRCPSKARSSQRGGPRRATEGRGEPRRQDQVGARSNAHAWRARTRQGVTFALTTRHCPRSPALRGPPRPSVALRVKSGRSNHSVHARYNRSVLRSVLGIIVSAALLAGCGAGHADRVPDDSVIPANPALDAYVGRWMTEGEHTYTIVRNADGSGRITTPDNVWTDAITNVRFDGADLRFDRYLYCEGCEEHPFRGVRNDVTFTFEEGSTDRIVESWIMEPGAEPITDTLVRMKDADGTG